jgi:hypothetical protein
LPSALLVVLQIESNGVRPSGEVASGGILRIADVIETQSQSVAGRATDFESFFCEPTS